MTVWLWGILAYVSITLVIGVLVSRRVRTEDDYLLAGRRLGPWVGVFTIFATWFGAETCVGASAEIYRSGLSGGSADPFGYVGCLLVIGLVLAAPLWRRRLTTLADLFRERWSRGVERTAALVMVPASVFWAGAQIRAFGQVLSASSTLDLETGMAIATGAVIVYTVFGGLLADAITDVFQGVVLIVGLLAIFFAVVSHLGSVPEALARVPAERWSLHASGASFLSTMEMWAVPILGSAVAQEAIARVLASRSAAVARGATLGAAGLYLIVGVIPAFIGLVGPLILVDLEDPEQVLAVAAQRYLGPVLFVVFAGALVSAILSTVDSALLAASSLLTHNVVFSFRPEASDRARVLGARIGVILFGFVAYALAVGSASVHAMVVDASSFGTSGVLVLVAVALATKKRRGSTTPAYVTLVGGVGTMVLCKFGIPGGAAPLVAPLNPESPFLCAVATAFLLYCGASAVCRQWSVLRALRRIWRS